MVWIGGVNTPAPDPCGDAIPLQLVAFEGQCLFKTAAMESLNRAGIGWDVSFTSSSLNGLLSATAAGLGITIRTAIGLPPRVAVLNPSSNRLPRLPKVDLTMIPPPPDTNPHAGFLAAHFPAAHHKNLL